MYLLGYDIGSSSIKTALIDARNNKVIDLIQYPGQEMEILSRQKGWAEQHPELWWRYLCQSTKKIVEKHNIDPKKIQSIGISYQMHGLVIVDKEYQILRPAIIWCDSRAVSVGDNAFRRIGKEFCYANLQNSPGNFTASKLKWVKDNEPDIYKKIYKIMLPGDYIAMRLTSKISTTISGLSEGILWNYKENKVATRVLDYYEFSHDLIPEILPTFSQSGVVSSIASEQTGLAEGIPVAYRAGDQPNNALSLNVLKPGEVAATCGTSGVVYGVVDKPIFDEHQRVNAFAHVNHSKSASRIGVLLCLNGAGIQYSWLRSQVARANRSYDDMERMLSSVPVGSEGVLLYPYGNGAERIFNNRNLGSHIRNLEFNRHTRAHLYRAAVEGVAFSFVYGIEILKEMGLKINKMRVGNDNMFKSKVFGTTISTLLGTEIEVAETTGAIGAALASGYGIGLYQSIEEAMSSLKIIESYSPAHNTADYSLAYHYWKDGLKDILNNKSETISLSDYDTVIDKKDQKLSKLNLLLQEQERKISEVKDFLNIINVESSNVQIRKMIMSLERSIDEVEDMSFHIDMLSDPFISTLKSRFPDLSFEELKMCDYLKLKYTTKEMAQKLNLSYRGTETKRYRLRKKMNVQKGRSLSAFLESIDIFSNS
jgi:xylulokinase